MEKLTLELPFLYADHHVLEVRKILGELPGITDLYVSSSFHTVEVTYDPALNDVQKITACLEEAGYLADAPMTTESGVSTVEQNMNSAFTRRTNVYENTSKVTSFTQNMPLSNRHVWPIPGMGVILSVKQPK